VGNVNPGKGKGAREKKKEVTYHGGPDKEFGKKRNTKSSSDSKLDTRFPRRKKVQKKKRRSAIHYETIKQEKIYVQKERSHIRRQRKVVKDLERRERGAAKKNKRVNNASDWGAVTRKKGGREKNRRTPFRQK